MARAELSPDKSCLSPIHLWTLIVLSKVILERRQGQLRIDSREDPSVERQSVYHDV